MKYLKAPTISELETLLESAGDSLLRVAVAPEAQGSIEAIDWLVNRGIKPSVAHTAATYEQTSDAFLHGADCGVHLYNGMTGLHHREPGCCGAVLYHDVLAELIADGIHVHPVMMQLAYRMKGYQQLALITDCMRAGLPDGDYTLGAQTVSVTQGQAKTADGSLAGSTCSLDSALRNMVQLAHVPEWEAVQMATAIPQSISASAINWVISKWGDKPALLWWMSAFISPIHSSEEIIFTLYPGKMHSFSVMHPSVKMRYL